MTNEFILVRHATCERMDEILLGRTVDAPLDARGIQQATTLGHALRDRDDLLIVSSPRLRTQQTAAAIAADTGAEVVTSHDVDEVDFGEWSGRDFMQLAGDASWLEWNQRRGSAATPSGERITDVLNRFTQQLHRLQLSYPGRPIAIVTHAEVIRTALLHWLGAPLDGYHRLAIHPASRSHVTLGDWGVRIENVNQRAGR